MKGTTAFELLAVPVLMTAVALNQIRMANGHSLSPWKGGGFGMFSTVDGPGNRRLACQGVDSSGRSWVVDVGGSPEYADSATRVYTYPTPRSLRALANRLLETPMVEIGSAQEDLAARLARDNPELEIGRVEIHGPFDILCPRADGDSLGGDAPAVRLASVELAVYRIEWDPRTATVRYRLLGDGVVASRSEALVEGLETAWAPEDPDGRSEAVR